MGSQIAAIPVLDHRITTLRVSRETSLHGE